MTMAARLTMTSSNPERDVRGSRGMAATSQPLATLTAVHVLNEGGSAVDAAIAANAMLGLVEPTGCGIGGDLFAIVWDPVDARVFALNASGRAPRALHLDRLTEALGRRPEIPLAGPFGVTVPGCVDGWYALHERFGRLEMARLLAPVIRSAEQGFPVTPVIGRDWAADLIRIQSSSTDLPDPGAFLSAFAPSGRAPAPGETHVNPDLARTLTCIAAEGREAFYTGRLAETIAESVTRRGGHLSADDLAGHRSEWVDPISAAYRGMDVFELPPNNQGVTVLQMLRLLEPFDLSSHGFGSADSLHLLIECKKLAFEDRARFISDPDFFTSSVDALLSEVHLRNQRDRIVPETAMSLDRASVPLMASGESGDTCYLTTADRDGMMVSLIQSNFMGLGSGIVPDGLGFGLQNRGALFSLDTRHPNVYAPGKRPFHTIIPAMVLEKGRPLISFGVMGGAMQPQGQVQILTNIIDFGMGLRDAGEAPRWRHVGSSRPTGVHPGGSGSVLHEPGFDERTIRDLRSRGHETIERISDGSFGGYQAIGIDATTGDYIGASESRKDGMALGL